MNGVDENRGFIAVLTVQFSTSFRLDVVTVQVALFGRRKATTENPNHVSMSNCFSNFFQMNTNEVVTMQAASFGIRLAMVATCVILFDSPLTKKLGFQS